MQAPPPACCPPPTGPCIDDKGTLSSSADGKWMASSGLLAVKLQRIYKMREFITHVPRGEGCTTALDMW